LANIIAPVLKRLLDASMSELVVPSGVLILSGILEEQVDEMIQKIKEHNLRVIEKRQIDDWVACVVSR
jgi:ribosomal protein L11 methyltransferase